MTGSAIAGLGTLLALMTAVWAASAARRDVSIVDVCWSLAVLAAAGVYASGADDLTLRRSVVLVAVFLWAIRLAGYLAWRGWGAAEDKRYRAMRARRPRFRWTSLFVVFWLQAVLAWIVALPLLAVMHVEEPGGPGLLDALGALLFLVGFGFEAAGDWQMARFKADPANRGAGYAIGASGALHGTPTTSARRFSGGACGVSPAQRPARSGRSWGRCS